jgi:hypothetical protein
MPSTPAHDDDAHPELSRADGGEVSFDDLNVVPCGPDCALPLAADLWRAWRVLPVWEKRVDAELPGDFAQLLPTLTFMPSTELHGRREPSPQCADHDRVEDALSEGPGDEIPDVLIDALREGLYRSIFALGAAWAQTRCERS